MISSLQLLYALLYVLSNNTVIGIHCYIVLTVIHGKELKYPNPQSISHNSYKHHTCTLYHMSSAVSYSAVSGE